MNRTLLGEIGMSGLCAKLPALSGRGGRRAGGSALPHVLRALPEARGPARLRARAKLGLPDSLHRRFPTISLTTLGACSVLPGSADLHGLCSVPSYRAWLVG